VKSKTQVGKRALNMVAKDEVLEVEKAAAAFFDKLPETDPATIDPTNARSVQYLEPMFEFSGACTGCGETPYVKLATQLFGDRMIVANATGCSSIYGGNLPTTPWSTDANGRGPAWSNSLFEDNAEFGFGMRLTVDRQHQFALELLTALAGQLGDTLVQELSTAKQRTASEIEAQRKRVAALRDKLKGIKDSKARHLEAVAEFLVRRSVWIMGGDGWAYDIGYGGLDHVLASGRDVNVLVLDTEVYSNTGGQASKATPLGAVAKFAAAGKPASKKDLGLLAMAYGNVYVARVAFGSSLQQTLQAFREAEEYPGASIIIAYSHCIAHGYDLAKGIDQQKAAVTSGHWPLFRYNPAHKEAGKNPFSLDSAEPKTALKDYIYAEARYEVLKRTDAERAKALLARAESEAKRRWKLYSELAAGSAFATAMGQADEKTGE
jgi:pyruvate-ferredoxin/flavodoxin oxidoreductase